MTTKFHYPAAGGLPAPSGALILLTRGGIPVIGQWIRDGFFIAWAPLPTRDKDAEQSLSSTLKESS